MASDALTNGADAAHYLGLAPPQEDAVMLVELELDGAPLWERCTGTLVQPEWVLTAKHCLHGRSSPQVTVIAGSSESDPSWESSGTVRVEHPSLDLMLVELETEAEGVTPLPIAGEVPAGFDVGSLVQLAGFGTNEPGPPSARTFLVEEVVELGQAELAVTANGLAGACFGDSGGPLLVRDDEGMARVLGVLSGGAAGCYGIDRYTRVDQAAAWLAERLGTIDVVDEHTGDSKRLGESGRCFDGKAVWSAEGHLEVELCGSERACGWDAESGGYRCVAKNAQQCRGLTDLGACMDGEAVRCDRGAIVADPCMACGFSCARSPQTGVATCSVAAM